MKQGNATASQQPECTDSSNSTSSVGNDQKWVENLEEPRIRIKLGNYQFRNNGSGFFAGRDTEKNKLKDILDSNWNTSGAYLISGYRGVGKTEFVNTTLEEYEKNDNKSTKNRTILKVRISLGNEKRLDSTLVLNDIVSLMLEELKEKFKLKLLVYRWLPVFPIITLIFLFVSTLELLPIFGQPLSALVKLFIPLKNGLDESVVRTFFQHSLLFGVILTGFWQCIKSVHIFGLSPILKIQLRLSHLLMNMNHSSEKSHGMNFKGISVLTRYRRPIFNNNEIELELKNILEIAKKSSWHIIFIFDELDKLTNRRKSVFEAGKNSTNPEKRNRKRQVDNLLGELKNLISTTPATYLFISGRDMYDAYLSELGSPNSLYESLFKDHIYIPSLLTDHSDKNPEVLDSMIEHIVVSQILSPKELDKEREKLTYLSLGDLRKNDDPKDKINDFFYIKIFIHFLTIHSWGNCKRIITIFDSFVTGDQKNGYELDFHTKDIQRLILSSNLYILFHHHLARIFTNADDKLVVSSFAVFHYIMKFHDMGFSRSDINRMYQTLNVHNSPELVKVVEIIINNVLSVHIRRVRNSYYRYRFSSLYEQEIHYITTISEKESAAFNFSLDAMDSTKSAYKKMLETEISRDEVFSKIAVADLHIILGNFHFWEQSFDEASTQYQSAISVYENEKLTDNIDVLMALVEAYMKRASVEERVGNYSLSAAIYIKAIEQVEKHCNMSCEIHVKDSKMDILKQPYWALKFLHLKRSAIHYAEDHAGEQNVQTEDNIESLLDWQVEDINSKGYPQCCSNQNNSTGPYYKQFSNLDVWHYRRAVIKFYMGQPGLSYKCFMNVARQLEVINSHDERTCYLGGKSLLRAGYSLLAKQSKEALLDMKNRVSEFQLEKSSNQIDKKSEYQNRIMELIEMLQEYLPSIHYKFNSLDLKTSLKDFRNHVLEYNDKTLLFKTIREKNTSKKDKYTNQEDKNDNHKDSVFPYAIGLISLSATAFERSRLNANSAAAYLSVVSIWTMLIEMLPWRLFTDNRASYEEFLDEDSKEKINNIISDFTKLRNKASNAACKKKHLWVEEAKKFAFERDSYSTSKAMSHSAKVLLRRSILNEDGGLFSKYVNISDMVSDFDFYKYYLYQHHSIFGQMTLSSIKWEEFSSQRISGEIDLEFLGDNKILPSSIRYYSTTLWLQGRVHLTRIIENKVPPSTGKGFLDDNLKQEAIMALVKLYRASQYVVKTAGDSSNAILPPLFLIYYNMWEVVFYLVEKFCDDTSSAESYQDAISKVIAELDKVLKKSGVKDVSSRILDLSNLSVYALDHFSIALKMNDANSKEATRTLRNKYYLDDDFEDDIFTLDWCYTQIFAPGIYIHSQVIKVEMARLQEKFKKFCECSTG